MRITELFLNNFRNYQNLHFSPGKNLNVLIGNNAQGKTNLLESIYVLLKGRSFRTFQEKDLINLAGSEAKLKAGILAYNQSFIVNVNLSKNKSKTIKINNLNGKISQLADNFGIVLFTPDHLSIIKGSPKERRRFLDLELASFYPQYNYYLSNYQKVLSQRNNLLKEIKEKKYTQKHSDLMDVLSLWDQQLFAYGSKVIRARLEILKKLIPVAQKIHNLITSNNERLTIKYLSSLNLTGNLQTELIYEQFEKVSLKLREQELYRTQTLVGPHRDDLQFLLANKSITNFGSQGQQRTIILTLKFALIELWKNELNEVPILLLDDVFFELDSNRQKYILELINQDIQVFITTTGMDNMNKYTCCKNENFYIHNGSICYE